MWVYFKREGRPGLRPLEVFRYHWREPQERVSLVPVPVPQEQAPQGLPELPQERVQVSPEPQ